MYLDTYKANRDKYNELHNVSKKHNLLIEKKKNEKNCRKNT